MMLAIFLLPVCYRVVVFIVWQITLPEVTVYLTRTILINHYKVKESHYFFLSKVHRLFSLSNVNIKTDVFCQYKVPLTHLLFCYPLSQLNNLFSLFTFSLLYIISRDFLGHIGKLLVITVA